MVFPGDGEEDNEEYEVNPEYMASEFIRIFQDQLSPRPSQQEPNRAARRNTSVEVNGPAPTIVPIEEDTFSITTIYEDDGGVVSDTLEGHARSEEHPDSSSKQGDSPWAKMLAEICHEVEENSSPHTVMVTLLKEWEIDGMIPQWQEKMGCTLKEYYAQLLRLYILWQYGWQSLKPDPDVPLGFAVLLQFQAQAFQSQEHLPEVQTIVQAFKYLDYDSPLCQRIAILFGSAWTMEEYEIEYKAFGTLGLDPNTESLAEMNGVFRFLHAVV